MHRVNRTRVEPRGATPQSTHMLISSSASLSGMSCGNAISPCGIVAVHGIAASQWIAAADRAFGPSLVEAGPICLQTRSKPGYIFGKKRPKLVEVGPNLVDLGQILSNVVENRSTSAQSWPTSARNSKPVQIWSGSANVVDTGPISVDVGADLDKVGAIWDEFGAASVELGSIQGLVPLCSRGRSAWLRGGFGIDLGPVQAFGWA